MGSYTKGSFGNDDVSGGLSFQLSHFCLKRRRTEVNDECITVPNDLSHFVCQTIPFILVNNRSKRHNENHPIVAFGTEPGPSFLHSSHGGDEVEPGTDQEI